MHVHNIYRGREGGWGEARDAILSAKVTKPTENKKLKQKEKLQRY